MYNDYMALRLGKERARELYRQAEEAGLTQRRWRERRVAGRARIHRAWAGLALAVVSLAALLVRIAA